MPSKPKSRPGRAKEPLLLSEDDAIRLLATPQGFAEGVLRMPPLYPWQKQILSWYADQSGRVRGAVAASNGSGKSALIIATLALWWVTMAKEGQCIIMSKDSRQIDNQVWPAIVRHSDKFPQYSFTKRRVQTPSGAQILLYTTDEPGRAEGYHAMLPDRPVLMIYDEAKSIPDNIFVAGDRCTFNGQLYISSTGDMFGRFFNAMTMWSDRYLTRTVTVDECPHTDQQRVADVIADYGIDHPFTRSTLYSEFMPEDEGELYFFHKHVLDNLIESPPLFKASNRVFFCDFAGGGDENVLACRDGNKVSLLKCWRDTNEMAAIGQFIRLFNQYEARPEEIFGDSAGMGKTWCARFDEQGWGIGRFNGAARAFDDHNYANRNAEVWDNAAKAARNGEVILPNDEKLLAQLVSRKRNARKHGAQDSRGRLLCESKPDMKARGINSPDRADAVVFVMSTLSINGGKNSSEVVPSWLEWAAENEFDETQEKYYVPGTHAGL